jgi:uncharacterized integral membrane protein
LIAFLLLLFAVCFALANRQQVALDLWPFGVTLQAPLFLSSLGALAAGMLIGGLFVWCQGLPKRVALWRLQRAQAQLEGELRQARAAGAARTTQPTPAPRLFDYFRGPQV